MDQRELGNLFIVGFHGVRFNDDLRRLMDDFNPCGIILFSRNIEDPLQVAELNRDLQRHCQEQTGHGLLIGVDQEGGRVRRVREPFSEFPAALVLASSPEPDESVRAFARTTARELRLVGFNLDFAPVMDVLSHTTDLTESVIGDRSYGSDPEVVARLGRVVVETFREEGIIPCCKHFPGHGGTRVDSHKDLPTDVRSAGDIEVRDLVPFAWAVRANAEMIMTAHILYPSWDTRYPATLSHAIITGLLREKMGYDRVIVTDDLDMGAVAGSYSPEESAARAFAAGVDIPLFCNDPEKAFSARRGLLQALKDGQIQPARVQDSLRRIRTLKSEYAPSMLPCDPRQVRAHFR